MTETAKSELETLKAQLASSESIRKAEKKILIEEIRLRSESVAKVRELRELLSSIQLVASAPWTSQSWMTFRKLIDEAALRSAPPSGPRQAIPLCPKCQFGMTDMTDRLVCSDCGHVIRPPAYQAFFVKTNAGEERKDLAQVPAAHHTRWEGENPHNATVGSRSPRSAESASTQSGPQDSPSRSEWKFVGDDELTNHFRRTHCLSDLTPEAWQTVANCLLRNFRVIKAAPPSPACNSMQDNKLATDLKSEPICPAREKEKAE